MLFLLRVCRLCLYFTSLLLSAVLDPGAAGFSEGGRAGAASSSAGMLSEDAASFCARGAFLNLFSGV